MRCPVCNTDCTESVCLTCGFSNLEMPSSSNSLNSWINSILLWRADYWESLTEFEIDGTSLIRYCGRKAFVSVPYGITRIAEGAFANNQALFKVSLPETVTTIEKNAFMLSSVEIVSFSEGLEVIENSAFWMSAIRNIWLPHSCKKIGNWAFKACSSLTTVHLATGLECIGYEAFVGCYSLDYIRIPSTLSEVGFAAFSSGSNPSQVFNESDTQRFRFIGGVLIDTHEHKLVSGFNNSTIPSDYPNLSIGQKAFCDCNEIQHIVIPAGVTRIEDSAFDSCKNLRTLAFMGYVPELGFCPFDSKVRTNVFLPECEQDSLYPNTQWIDNHKEVYWNWELFDGHPEIIVLDTGELTASLRDYWYNHNTDEFEITLHCTNRTGEERYFYLENLQFNYVDCPILPFCSVLPHSDLVTSWTFSAEHTVRLSVDPDARFGFAIRVAKSERMKKHKNDIWSDGINHFPVFLGE